MCYYDLVKFSCSHREWSNVRQPCDDAQCQEQRIRRHVHIGTNDVCSKCRRHPSDPHRARLYGNAESSLPTSNMILGVYKPMLDTMPCRLISHDRYNISFPWGTHQLRIVTSALESAPFAVSTDTILKLSTVAKQFAEQRERLVRRVMEAMRHPEDSDRKGGLPVSSTLRPFKARSQTTRDPGSPYSRLNLKARQIRLLRLNPNRNPQDLSFSFRCMELSHCPRYTALSYTWGDEEAIRNICVGGGGTINIRENLWSFLRLQSSIISKPKFFWIDAICINQSNVHERNHQVNMMKQIYVNAFEVYIWLGLNADNSDLAMDFIAAKGTRGLRRRGPGFHAIWPRHVGKALYDLCERAYWRRMWIIQEIVHANNITVWCGAKSFRWYVLESLYLTLKTLEETSWFAHHPYAIRVLQSSACTMVWQRAHWRHPDTPSPRLQVLINTFRDWQCTDIRDKVYALVSMASHETAIVPDYSKSTLDVYRAVQDKHDSEKHEFYNMLSQILAIPQRDLNFERDLIEYKRHPPEQLVLRDLLGDYFSKDYE
ncbi:hypothetical protein LCI18_000105 [Fusarium solani-melongenae]|uniref:Uncharacterized protein n=1 Tax=Fusarium solani subsp. cucurbitae TaxID=2747967 RepID=A0ACD3YJZ6_FUSSC|nr:hypothetical protein LCI18_000105 [Fusarium solani-melongenae]